MPTLYVDLLRLLAGVKWDDPESVRQALMQLAKEIEDKLTSLDSRVTALE